MKLTGFDKDMRVGRALKTLLEGTNSPWEYKAVAELTGEELDSWDEAKSALLRLFEHVNPDVWDIVKTCGLSASWPQS